MDMNLRNVSNSHHYVHMFEKRFTMDTPSGT